MKVLHTTGTHIRSAASTIPAPNLDDEVGDAPQDESCIGQEPPLSAASEHPNVDQRSGTGDVGNAGDGSDGGASRVWDATSPSSSSSSGSSNSESDGGSGNRGRKGGKDKKKEDEQVDKVFWLEDLHAHRREKEKSRKCHGNDLDLQTTMDAQSVSRIQDLTPTPCLSYCNHLRCYSIRQRTEDGGTDQG